MASALPELPRDQQRLIDQLRNAEEGAAKAIIAKGVARLVIPHLVEVLRDTSGTSPWACDEAGEALYALGGPEYLPVLVGAFDSYRCFHNDLARKIESDRCCQALAELLVHGEADVRRCAADLFGRMAEATRRPFVPLFLQHLDADDPMMRCTCLNALSGAVVNNAAVRQRVTELAHDPVGFVRNAVASVLVEMEPEASEALYLQALRDTDEGRARNAALMLLTISHSSAVANAALERLATSGQTPRLRVIGMTFLKSANDETVSFLRKALSSATDSGERVAAARALGALRLVGAEADLQAVVDDPDPALRLNARFALIEMQRVRRPSQSPLGSGFALGFLARNYAGEWPHDQRRSVNYPYPDSGEEASVDVDREEFEVTEFEVTNGDGARVARGASLARVRMKGHVETTFEPTRVGLVVEAVGRTVFWRQTSANPFEDGVYAVLETPDASEFAGKWVAIADLEHHGRLVKLARWDEHLADPALNAVRQAFCSRIGQMHLGSSVDRRGARDREKVLEAKKLLDEVERYGPVDGPTRVARGRCNEKLERFDEAEAEYTEAWERAHEAAALEARARVRSRRGRVDEALSDATALEAISANFAHVTAVILKEHQRWKPALDAYNRFEEAEPSAWVSWNNPNCIGRAECKLALGDAEGALADLENTNANSGLLRAKVLVALGRFNDALTAAQAYLPTDDPKQAQELAAQLERARTLAARRR